MPIRKISAVELLMSMEIILLSDAIKLQVGNNPKSKEYRYLENVVFYEELGYSFWTVDNLKDKLDDFKNGIDRQHTTPLLNPDLTYLYIMTYVFLEELIGYMELNKIHGVSKHISRRELDYPYKDLNILQIINYDRWVMSTPAK